MADKSLNGDQFGAIGLSNGEEKDDYFSCDSGIGALKFRKRLEQLQGQSKKLEQLTNQLGSIKDRHYVADLESVCAISIVQELKNGDHPKSEKQRKRRKLANSKVVFTRFSESDTERAFHALHDRFESVSYSYWKDTTEAANDGLILSYPMVESTYTLFRKSLNDKAILCLMAGRHDEAQTLSYRLQDILNHLIVDWARSLQIAPDRKEKEKKEDRDRKLSLFAMTEILEEVFSGNCDETFPLNETEFVTVMRVRIGMDSAWKSETKQKLHRLFHDILDAANDTNSYHWDDDQRACITFNDFITYFSPHIRSDDEAVHLYRDRFEVWKDIKNAVKDSPLSARNQSLREKESVSAIKYREKLSDIEKVISLLEEAIILEEAKEIKSKSKERMFWRKKILKHREFVRFYQDVILQEVIAENHKMKARIERLAKINKFRKKMAMEEEEWFRKNEHLLQIEEQYYAVLRQQKEQQMMMKKVEKLVTQKDAEIYRLKSQLMEMKKKQNTQSVERVQKRERDNHHNLNAGGGVMNDKLLRLKGEIALKKLEIQEQLNVMNSNINDDIDDRIVSI